MIVQKAVTGKTSSIPSNSKGQVLITKIKKGKERRNVWKKDKCLQV